MSVEGKTMWFVRIDLGLIGSHNKMNIRRFKKKKCVTLGKNEEELAKDKLFEISYCEDKYIDESHFLAADMRQEEQKHNRSEELERIIRTNNRENNRSRPRLTDTRLEGTRIDRLPPSHDKCIFNVLESKAVFVGAKEQQPTSTPEIILLASRKRLQPKPEQDRRLQTMPQLNKRDDNGFKLKIKTEETERAEKQLMATQGQKFPRMHYSVNKRNYCRLKERLRYDLFVKSLNCTVYCRQS